MLIFFLINKEGLKVITFLAEILASAMVLGFLPNLSFLLIILKVPNDEIFTLFNLINSLERDSKKRSTKRNEKFFEKPKLL